MVADLPMDKNYKIIIQDFCRLPILSDDVFKAMDKNNDGEVSKVTSHIDFNIYISYNFRRES